MTRKKLTDILFENDKEKLTQAWESTEAAQEWGPLPRGEYIARITGGELATSRQNTPSYKLKFEIIAGDYEGQKIWHDVWLTPAALPMAKRDLGKLGIRSLEQLETPLPEGIRCKVHLVLRQDDNGEKYNRLRSFEVVGIDPPEPEPFAPVDEEPDERPDVSDEEMDPDVREAIDDIAEVSFPGDCNEGEGK